MLVFEMNGILALLVALCTANGAVSIPLEIDKAYAELTKSGFTEIHGETYYIADKAIQTDTKVEVDKETYSLDSEGIVQKGLQQEEDGLHYYAEEDGKQETGFQTVKEDIYYFDKETGVAQTGEQEIDGNKFVFDEDGKMQTGIVDGTLYQADGTQVANKWVDGRYYGKEGKVETGVTKIDGKTYYLDENGKPQSGYAESRYFDDKGQMFVGEGNTTDNRYIKTDEDGTITYNTSSQAQLAVESAYRQLGRDQWCTELVNNALQDAGLTPQGTFDWYRSIGHWVDEPQPGDICMYSNHVSLYIGNGQSIHGGWLGSGIPAGQSKTTRIYSYKTAGFIGFLRVFD